MPVIDMTTKLREIGMIASSPSIWRFWIVQRWRRYPWINLTAPCSGARREPRPQR